MCWGVEWGVLGCGMGGGKGVLGYVLAGMMGIC